jgi:hypothetical protein
MPFLWQEGSRTPQQGIPADKLQAMKEAEPFHPFWNQKSVPHAVNSFGRDLVQGGSRR